jgi:branched-chain amino acid transport system permease protein
LSGVGGVLIGLDTSIDPLTGYRVLLSVFAAAVLGGLGSIPGAVVGALALGVGEELALIVVPATYRTAVGFAAILIMLTFRPRGILGERAA